MPLQPLRSARTACLLLAPGLGLALAGCSIVTPEPVWELTKATASVVSLAVSSAPAQSSDTVRHFSGALDRVCIRLNQDTQVPDIVPALQAELRKHNVDSRVYDVPVPAEQCAVWLKYAAAIDWDTPPFSSQYKPYIRQAALTLRSASGEVLSSSHYAVDEGFGTGKWASTRQKMSPVVTALLTGVEQPPTNPNNAPAAARH